MKDDSGMDNQQPRINILDLGAFRKKRRGRPKKHLENLTVEITWFEYDKDENQILKSLKYEVDDIYHTFKDAGRREFVDKCFQVLGDIFDSDPSLAVELEDRLKELYDSQECT